MFADYHREADVLRINTVHHETWTTWIYKPLEINPESSCCDHRLLERHKISWLKKKWIWCIWHGFMADTWWIVDDFISERVRFNQKSCLLFCRLFLYFIHFCAIFQWIYSVSVIFFVCLWGKITISMEHSLFMRKRLWTIWTLSIWTQDKTMSRQCISICDCLNEVVGDECLFE